MRARRLLRGGTLQQVLDREARLPQRDLCAVARRVLLGLRNMQASARLHHVDVKPSNVGLLEPGDYATTVLMDFGSALPLGAAHAALMSQPPSHEPCAELSPLPAARCASSP